MNNLSWFIYLAGFVGNLTGFLIFVLIFGLGALAFYSLIEEHWPKKRYLFGFLVLGFFITLLPSSSTIKLVAASEFAERVIYSERVQGIVDPGLKYVEKWLKDQLKEKKND